MWRTGLLVILLIEGIFGAPSSGYGNSFGVSASASASYPSSSGGYATCPPTLQSTLCESGQNGWSCRECCTEAGYSMESCNVGQGGSGQDRYGQDNNGYGRGQSGYGQNNNGYGGRQDTYGQSGNQQGSFGNYGERVGIITDSIVNLAGGYGDGDTDNYGEQVGQIVDVIGNLLSNI